MKRKVASAVLLACVVLAIAFELLSRTCVWASSTQEIRDVGIHIRDSQLAEFVLALLASAALIVHAWRAEDGDRKWWVTLFLCLSIVFVLTRVCSTMGLVAAIVLVQKCVGAMYVLVCYGIARWSKVHVVPWNTALATFVVAHVVMVFFCSWDPSVRAFVLSPVVVVWMAMAFLIVLVTEYWREFADMGWPLKLGYCAAIVISHVVFFSMFRVLDILSPLWRLGLLGDPWVGKAWWDLRAHALEAHLTGGYLELIGEPAVRDSLESNTIVWLRAAFGEWHQLAYVALFAVCMLALWWILRGKRDRDDSLVGILAWGAMASNLWGLACSVFLFRSGHMGTLASANLFQIVPLLCLVAWGLGSSELSSRCNVFFFGWADDNVGIMGPWGRSSFPSFAIGGNVSGESELFYVDDDLFFPSSCGGWSYEDAEEFARNIAAASVGISNVRVRVDEGCRYRISFGLSDDGGRVITSGGEVLDGEGNSILVVPKWGEFNCAIGSFDGGLWEVLCRKSFHMK